MSIAFYYPTQAAPGAQWTPAKAPRFPLKTASDFPGQVVGETAGGTVHVQDSGTLAERWELVFERLTPDDHASLQAFFQTVRKSFHAFEYVDPAGAARTVRWMNDFEFEESVPGRFSGTIVLRKE